MKIVSYNINGIRASIKAGIIDWLKTFDADIYCFQEVRCDENTTKQILFGCNSSQISLFESAEQNNLNDYYATYNCGGVAGYAGTMILSKTKPDSVKFDMGEFWTDNEGRTTTAFFKNFAVVNAYIPNGNSRLDFKMQYLSALNKYLADLAKKYFVLCVGDFNIAHNEIDLTNPKECKNKSVFLPIERDAFSAILNVGYLDCFRYLKPNEIKYSWRSYRTMNVEGYTGWQYRIDYALITSNLKQKLANCDILNLPYSDHLPVIVELEM